MATLFILLVLYQIKHFLADYPFQTEYMLGKFKEGSDFVVPLLTHVAVHGAMTFGIVLLFTRSFVLSVTLAAFDAAVHFGMDRIKASKKYLGKYKPLFGNSYVYAHKRARRENDYFWWSIGVDQMVHHLTHYAIIACVAVHLGIMS